MECFAVCTPGLESFTARELAGLGLTPRMYQDISLSAGELERHELGGVAFDCSMAELIIANQELRTATRVLVRLGHFNAAKFVELRRKAAKLPWEQYLQPGQAVEIRATSHQSRLYHTGAIEKEVIQAISERLGAAPAGGTEPPQRIIVRFLTNDCTISLDSSGEPLHRRGYRLASAKAPLRESLAAGLLYAAGWDCQSPLLDLFCGSGTIPIEAALMAAGTNPRAQRSFAFQSWQACPEAEIMDRTSGATKNRETSMPTILGSDRDAGAIEMAQANAARAGVGETITFTRQAFSNVEPPDVPGWVVTNPPYGQRVSHGRDLRNLYAQLGNVLYRSFVGWKFAILCNDRALIGQTQLTVTESYPLINGGLSVRLYCGRVD